MPNWATGTMKIRGTKVEILRFCTEQMNELAGHIRREGNVDGKVTWDVYDDELTATVRNEPSLFIWLKDSNRNFVDMDHEVPYCWDQRREGDAYETFFNFYKMPEKDYCVVFPFIAAWGVHSDYFDQLSKEYKLTFRIYTVEQGMGFFEELVSKDGKTTEISGGPSFGKDEDTKEWYGRFVWECPFPFLGG